MKADQPSLTSGEPSQLAAADTRGKKPPGVRGHWLWGCARRIQLDPLGFCLHEWKQLQPRQVVDIVPAMMRLALRVAGTTLFNTDITLEADAIGQAYRTAFAHISSQMNSPPWVPWWLPTRANRRFVQAKRLLDQVVLQIIAARRQHPDPPRDLLSLLLAAQDEETGLGMTDQQVKDEVLTMLTAGHETVGAALSWTWYLLGQHPDTQEALYEEVHGLLQSRGPTSHDLPQLPLTRAVFDEAMRLYPPAWGVAREAREADNILGYTIPKGAIIIVGTYVMHRRPDLWPEPERFCPERFTAASGGRHKFAYLPFGGGPRLCIGQAFALMEGPLVLATLAQRFRVELAPNQVVAADPTFTLRPRNGVQVVLSQRS